MNIRNRVKAFRMMPASDLRPNPKNWRTHPKAQQDALRAVLAEVGFADACLARELPDGSFMLIDGHLRAETLGDGEVPVLILDVNEAEADKILLLLDPLAGMAGTNTTALSELLHGVATTEQSLAELFEDMAADAGIIKPDSLGEESGEDEPATGTERRCPRCGEPAEGDSE
jgi:ParB-like chromosome segregation protein Spo0J